MRRTATFDYYYGIQADAYSFYRIPKVLFTDPFFRQLSCEAKVLYGLLLDRMSLSVKNRWFDEEDRVYIIFTIKDIREMMGCCTATAVKIMNELDTDHGIGLVEKRRLGLGKANVIYVKNFMLRDEAEPDGQVPDRGQEMEGDDLPDEVNTGALEPSESPETRIDTQSSKKQNSGILNNRIQELQETEFRDSEKQNSGVLKSRTQEFYETECSNTDINKTDYSKTEKNETDINLSIRERLQRAHGSDRDEMDEYHAYEELIRKNIEYESLLTMYDREDVDEIVSLMTDTVCSSKKSIVIGGESMPAQVVKSRLLKVDYSHIQYVFFCMQRNTTKVRNIRQYLLTALYNAPSTMSHFYSAEVNHDMYGID